VSSGSGSGNPTLDPGRPGFMEWLNRQQDPPAWAPLPLFHTTRGVIAEDVIRAMTLTPSPCSHFDQPLSYFFYGRPAYRVSTDNVVKSERFCPFSFVFKPELAQLAAATHAFDTGAFFKRLYQGIVGEDIRINDFQLLGTDAKNRLISAVFKAREAYIRGDTREILAEMPSVEAYEFHARAYLDIILAPGRNEPDDRVFTIELVIAHAVSLAQWLMAVIVPHTMCGTNSTPEWIKPLLEGGVKIIPYEFLPGRSPEYYHALLEIQAVDFCLPDGL
jgi:hypothetical protein